MAKSIYARFGTDNEKESNGIKLDFGDGLKFHVLHIGPLNTRFQRIHEARLRPYQRQIKSNLLSTLELRELTIDIFVDAALLGWEGVEDDAGAQVKFSPDAAKKLFRDLPELFYDVYAASADSDNFRKDLEETAKN